MGKFRIYDKVYEAETPDAARVMYLNENRPGFLEGLIAHFGQGLSLGAADEMTAGLEALRGNDYTASMRRQQAQRDSFAKDNPMTAAIATGAGAITPVLASAFGGSLAGPGGTVAAGTAAGGRALALTRAALTGQGASVPVTTIGQGIKEGAKVGLPIGGISGWLSADPEAGGGLFGGRTDGTLLGAGAGTALGAGVGGVVQAGQQTAQAARPVLQRAVNSVRNAVTPTSLASNTVPAAAPAVAPSMNPTAAEQKVLDALLRSGVSPEAAAIRLQQARQAGVPLGLVDVGGAGTQRLGRTTRTLPGEGSTIVENALEQRAAGQRDRVVNFLEGAAGARTTGNSGQTVDDLLNLARANSGPLYRSLRRFPAIEGAEMQSIFSTPAVRDIMREHERALGMGGRRVNPMYDAEGNMLRAPTLADIDMVKQTLDTRLSPSYQRAAQGRPTEGLDQSTRTMQDTYDILRRRLLREADSSFGGRTYSQARAAYAGPAQARDAYQAGLEMPNSNTMLQDVIANVNGNSPDFYRRGMVEALRGKVDAMPDLTSQPNRVRAFYGNARDRAKVDAAVLPEQRDLLRQRMDMENQSAQTNNFLRGGSQTADKLAEGVDDVAGDFVRQTVAQGPMAAARAQAVEFLNSIRGSVGQQTRAEVARQLTNFNDPAAQQAFLRRLSELQRRGEMNATTVQRAAQAATTINEVR